MGFKMGTNRGLEAKGGEIKTKMRFGKQSGGMALYLEHLLLDYH